MDIGGTKVALALVTPEGVLMWRHRYPLQETPPAQIPQALFAHIDAFLAEYEAAFTLVGIGVGLKGTVALDQYTIVSSSILAGLLPYDLCGALMQRYGVPCKIGNDVHSPLIRKLSQVYGEMTGLPSEPRAVGGTYSKFVPTICGFGAIFPGTKDMCHVVDESLNLEEFVLLGQIYANAIYELATMDG